MNDLNTMLSNLQNQLSSISTMVQQNQNQPQQTQQHIQQQPPQQFQYIPQPAMPDISQMVNNAVKQALQSEMARLAPPAPVPVVTPPVQEQPKQESTMNIPSHLTQAILPIIGTAFTTQQQEWISQPQNLLGLPGFLMSANGKSALGMLLEEYQTFCGVDVKK